MENATESNSRAGKWMVSGWLCLWAALPVVAGQTSPEEGRSGIKVPAGFESTLYADDNLAPNIYSMTIDSQGRVVVSGPGYIRILIDGDGDGVAERYRQFADGPKTGAQGMFFHGRDLLCVGDAGLLRYKDRNADDRADGPPDVFLKIKAGGEHHAHAIRKGPDGWWYLLAGNTAGVTEKYATLSSSPVRKPSAGTLLRLRPNLEGGEIVADGYRNAYDFAFNSRGDAFTFDSDGERDVSLPWYRPTRVFQMLPGSNAGWVTRSWKRPDSFFDMPPVVGSFGRGSPTGVACYRHKQFPPRYQDTIFALDWTFGRVIALPLSAKDSVYESKPINFMTGTGTFGFAPTDVAVGADGSLFVSVGGRGTRGGVYRVTHPQRLADVVSEQKTDKLAQCLDAPQPLASWSRARWQPLAAELGEEAFLGAALDGNLSPARRVRAIEILTDRFTGLDENTLTQLQMASAPEVRARAVWSLGRLPKAKPTPELIKPFLEDEEPLVVRFALEALLGISAETDLTELLPAIAKALGNRDRYVRQVAYHLVKRLPATTQESLKKEVQNVGATAVVFQVAATLQPVTAEKIDRYALAVGMAVLKGKYSSQLKVEAVRLLQLALGDVGPGHKLPAVYDGYAPHVTLEEHKTVLDAVRKDLIELYPVKDTELDWELARLISMVQPESTNLRSALLTNITTQSNPVEDLHHLIVASRIPGEISQAQRNFIAQALVNLDAKIIAQKLKQDRNWEDRVMELYQQLVKADKFLPSTIIHKNGFGRPGHILFLSELDGDSSPAARINWVDAINAFVKQVQEQENYLWTPKVVFIVGDEPQHRELVRQQFNNFSVRSAVLIVLANDPDPRDRAMYVTGLELADLEALESCIKALESFERSRSPKELFALYRLATRLNKGKPQLALRERVVKLLQQSTGQSFGFVTGSAGYKSQKDVLDKWEDWLRLQFPQQAVGELGGGAVNLEELHSLLETIDWRSGDQTRGRKLFEQRACVRCHGGSTGLGPDLSGVALRFSRKDLFTAIAAPGKDVPSRYRSEMIQTTSGKVYSGLIVYESVDGLILRDANNRTYRIESDEIELRRSLGTSLMPDGLLKDLKPGDLADLYSYLQSLGKSNTTPGAE